MIPTYPAILPLPIRDGYTVNPVNKIRSTDMDVGRAVQRWEFDDAPLYVEASWVLTTPESQLFIAWVNQVAKAGWVNMRLVTSMGIENLVVRFRSTPEPGVLVGQYCWKYSAVLEIEFEPMIDIEWLEFPEFILEASIIDYAANREWPLSPWQIHAAAFDEAINLEWPTP